jgi:hypothetical protein
MQRVTSVKRTSSTCGCSIFIFFSFFRASSSPVAWAIGEEEAGRQNELLRLALQSIQDLNVAVHRRAEYCWRLISPDFRELFNLSSEKLIEASRMIILLRIQPSLFHRPEARGAVEELELPTSSAKRMSASRW